MPFSPHKLHRLEVHWSLALALTTLIHTPPLLFVRVLFNRPTFAVHLENVLHAFPLQSLLIWIDRQIAQTPFRKKSPIFPRPTSCPSQRPLPTFNFETPTILVLPGYGRPSHATLSFLVPPSRSIIGPRQRKRTDPHSPQKRKFYLPLAESRSALSVRHGFGSLFPQLAELQSDMLDPRSEIFG